MNVIDDNTYRSGEHSLSADTKSGSVGITTGEQNFSHSRRIQKKEGHSSSELPQTIANHPADSYRTEAKSKRDASYDNQRARRQGYEPRESFGITCPRCGGSLIVQEGERSVRCEYCDSALYIARPKGVKSFMTKPAISPGRAKLTTLRYINRKTAGRIKARHTSIVDIQLIHVPFWRMHGRLVGWACGEKVKMIEVEVPSTNPHSCNTRKITREERKKYSKLVFKNIDWSTPACTMPHLGLQGISLRTKFLKWDIFSHRFKDDYTFALPMKNARNAKVAAYKYLSRLSSPAGSTVRASKFQLFDSEMSLYYYPVYIIRYRHHEKIYSVTVDGSDGHIIRGDHPVKRNMNPKNIFFITALAALMASTWFPLLIISIVSIYIFDLLTSGGPYYPYRWIMNRLGRWFG